MSGAMRADATPVESGGFRHGRHFARRHERSCHHRFRRRRRHAGARADAARHQGRAAGSRRAPVAGDLLAGPGRGLRPAHLARAAHAVGHRPRSPRTSRRCHLDRKTVGGTTVHWTGVAPRAQPWEMRARSTYGSVDGHVADRLADRLRGAVALLRAGREAHGGHAPQRRAGPAGVESLQGDVLRRAQASATSTCTPATWPSIRVRRTAAACASSRASACRAARPAPSGARCTRRFRAPRRPATSTCGPNAARCASSMAPMAA